MTTKNEAIWAVQEKWTAVSQEQQCHLNSVEVYENKETKAEIWSQEKFLRQDEPELKSELTLRCVSLSLAEFESQRGQMMMKHAEISGAGAKLPLTWRQVAKTIQ